MHGSVDAGNFILRNIDGERTLLAPGLATETAGTRILPSGDWVFADIGSGTLWRVEPSGSSTEVLSGLMYPNGVEVDSDGYVYVAENDAQRVRRIDPYTGEFTIVATGVLNANGLILSPDEQTLYISTCYGSLWEENPIAIYGVDRLGEEEWAEPRAVLEAVDQPCYDAINVDICGNIYVADYDTGWNARINRLSADGTQFDVIADVDSEWVPNMRWGNGIGGWESDVLYAADRFEGLLFALDMGIEGKPHLLAAD
jgi:sugar lactone lactonase YvrE